MKNCRNCKHWDQDRDPAGNVYEGYPGYCGKITEGGSEIDAWMTAPSLLSTRETFGCNLHEPREGT